MKQLIGDGTLAALQRFVMDLDLESPLSPWFASHFIILPCFSSSSAIKHKRTKTHLPLILTQGTMYIPFKANIIEINGNRTGFFLTKNQKQKPPLVATPFIFSSAPACWEATPAFEIFFQNTLSYSCVSVYHRLTFFFSLFLSLRRSWCDFLFEMLSN